MLKLHLVENDANEGSEKNVGNFQFDLKEAIPSAKPLDNPEESYIVVRMYLRFIQKKITKFAMRLIVRYNSITKNLL